MTNLPASFPTDKVREMLADSYTAGVVEGLESAIELLEASGAASASVLLRPALALAKALPPAKNGLVTEAQLRPIVADVLGLVDGGKEH